MIRSILQYCYNKPMMTYLGTWKTLSRSLDTRRTLFLVSTEVFLWDVNPASEQTPLKGSSLMSSHVEFWSRVLAGRPLLVCMRRPQLQHSCTYVWNQSSILCYHIAQEQQGLSYEGLVLWQKEHRGIRHGACSRDLYLLDFSCKNSSP